MKQDLGVEAIVEKDPQLFAPAQRRQEVAALCDSDGDAKVEHGAAGLRLRPGLQIGGHDGGRLGHVIRMGLEAGEDDRHDVMPVRLPFDDGAVHAALLARHKGDGEVGGVLGVARHCLTQHRY